MLCNCASQAWIPKALCRRSAGKAEVSLEDEAARKQLPGKQRIFLSHGFTTANLTACSESIRCWLSTQ